MACEILIALILDLIIGDPYSFPHPVKLMGRIINFEDRLIRKNCRDGKKLRLYGFLVCIINIIMTFYIGHGILSIFFRRELIKRLINIYLIYTCLAARSLDYEASKVLEALETGLEEGRHRLSYIVGRDTSNLGQDEIIKATIETVSENTSDGIIAPLFYIFLLGAPGGLMYKMVNTMDSMLGYKNEKYIDFGRYPARIDDVFNFLPSRITGVLMGILGFFINKDARALKILWRDRRNHSSPNAGYPEAAIAGILGIELGGGHIYGGDFIEKPTIGDNIRPVRQDDIKTTIKVMYGTEFLFTILCFLLLYLY